MSEQHGSAPRTRRDGRHPVVIRKLASGVPGLDAVLGGGIPEYSFNMIAGAPGSGKTTMAEQIMFANATPERPALHFTVLGEPPLKMLRYQQQFDFFDLSRVGTEIRFLNLSDEVLKRDLDGVFDRIVREVEATNPGVVVVDSFRTVVRSSEEGSRQLDLQHFVQRLALRLTSWEATTFLLGEYGDSEARSPVFTVADGVIWLSNDIERNATVRRMHVSKIRGQAPLPGLHTMRITHAGVEIFPRNVVRTPKPAYRDLSTRLSTGVAGLDEMLGGGIPNGDSVLVSGPTGGGKTVLGTQFVVTGTNVGERGVIAIFEEHPDAYLSRAKKLGFDLEALIDAGMLDVIFLRPLDLSVDETLRQIEDRVHALGATRVVIDSISGFEIALSSSFRHDFRESYYRLLQSLTQYNVTVMSLMENSGETDYLRFSPYNVSFLSDDVIALRYVELEAHLCTVLCVIKMRGSDHSKELRLVEITPQGMEVKQTLGGFRGTITGVPKLHVPRRPGIELSPTDDLTLDVLARMGEMSAQDIADELGLTLDIVTPVLEELTAGRYVTTAGRDGQTAYRLAQPASGSKRPRG